MRHDQNLEKHTKYHLKDKTINNKNLTKINNHTYICLIYRRKYKIDPKNISLVTHATDAKQTVTPKIISSSYHHHYN